MKNNKNISRFTKAALREIKLSQEVEKWSPKELADYLIQKISTKTKIGTKQCCVIDRVINILFRISEIEQNVQN